MFYYTVGILSVLFVVLWIITQLWRRPWVSDITRKAVFITGCDSGFGRATALSLDALGVPVFAGCYTEDGAKSLKASGSSCLHTLPLDVTKEDSVKRAYTYVMDNLPKDGTVLWGIINNAGVFEYTWPLDMTTTQDFRMLYDINVFGMVAVTTAFLPALKHSRGRIINTSSLTGIVPTTYLHNYASSKSAIKGFSDCIRLELSRWGIGVAVVMPGSFDTGINSNSVEQLERAFNAKPDISHQYGPDYLEAEKVRAEKFMRSFTRDLSPVVDSYQHALFARHPRAHYLVGPFSTVLPFIVLHAPTCFTDWLLLNLPGLKRPLPQVLKK